MINQSVMDQKYLRPNKGVSVQTHVRLRSRLETLDPEKGGVTIPRHVPPEPECGPLRVARNCCCCSVLDLEKLGITSGKDHEA